MTAEENQVIKEHMYQVAAAMQDQGLEALTFTVSFDEDDFEYGLSSFDPHESMAMTVRDVRYPEIDAQEIVMAIKRKIDHDIMEGDGDYWWPVEGTITISTHGGFIAMGSDMTGQKKGSTTVDVSINSGGVISVSSY